MNKKIIKKIQYAIELKLASPLCVSGGLDDNTDSDVQKNAYGEPFIPGTSMAGAMRGYLTEVDEISDVNALFGYSEGEAGTMSRIQISDFYFEGTPQLSVRDGVALADKLAVDGSKHDMEIIETGAVCRGYFLLNIRQGDDEDEFANMINLCIKAMAEGDVRLGANKNRGFGQLSIEKAHCKTFETANIMEWLSLDRETLFDDDSSKLDYMTAEAMTDKYITIQVPLKLKGGISIRKYSVVPNQPDYEHITCNGNAVIPGSSWNGAIRSRVYTILRELGVDGTTYINEWFGYVKNKTARQSMIVIEESVIEGSKSIAMTRNSVNRFDGSALTGALYTEKTNVGGAMNLVIKVRKNYYDAKAKLNKDAQFTYEPIVGMLLVAAKDIQNGYLAVGGQTAVGRGIFESNGDIKLTGTDKNIDYFINTIGRIKEVGQHGDN